MLVFPRLTECDGSIRLDSWIGVAAALPEFVRICTLGQLRAQKLRDLGFAYHCPADHECPRFHFETLAVWTQSLTETVGMLSRSYKILQDRHPAC